MRLAYSVTFEFETLPPLTHKGVVEASRVHTCVSRAVQQAQQALRPVNWSSLLCVLLERLDSAPRELVPAEVEGHP